MTTVVNLKTGDVLRYSCSPREAVISAHAQSLGDWNTWGYQTRYGNMTAFGKYTVSCGDMCAFQEQYAGYANKLN